MPLGTLDELGIRYVTDKSSLVHNYMPKYERLFAPFRDAKITILEIGVFDGGSLLAWESYFPRATIVGLDIRPACKQHEGGRRVIEIASQADTEAMSAIGQKYKPQIIIDDGSHQADHILVSFQALYSSLGEGGLYIVEDLHIHAGRAADRFRGSAPFSPQHYFLQLANLIVCPREHVQFDKEVVADTEAVEFFANVAVIRKKGCREQDHIESRRALAEQLESHRAWHWLSSYCRRSGGAKEDAIEYARRAIAMAPTEVTYYLTLSSALEQNGELEQALVAVQEARRLEPRHRGVLETADRLSMKIEALAGHSPTD